MQDDQQNPDLSNRDIVQALISIAQAISGKATPYVDANGWTVYDYGLYKEYRKRVTFNVAAGTAVLAISSTNFPVGVSSLGNVFISYSWATQSNAFDADISMENSTLATSLNFTYQSAAAQIGFIDLLFVTKF